MESLSLKKHHILSLSKTENNTYILTNNSAFIGKLSFLVSENSLAMFDNKQHKYIFKQRGFWKPIIKICYFGGNKVLYTLNCNLRKNTSVSIFGSETHKATSNGFLLNIYWEWHAKFDDKITTYTHSLGALNPITVKISVPNKIKNDLNMLSALGCFVLLNYERLTTNHIQDYPEANQQLARSVFAS